ncbi:MAG: dTDP-4-dehydrorhamnose 3,5-epimerase family protein [Actinomycetes bacterium]
MKVTALGVPDAYLVVPVRHEDARGTFLEWFRQDLLGEVVGYPVDVAQANCSVSRAGVVRGIHYSDVPPGQAKYVTCVSGAVLDVVVDLRVGSPTFAAHDAVRLDDQERHAVYLAEGLGHGFVALTEQATVVYLCSTAYAPEREHEIDAFDPALGIEWPITGESIRSDKDADALGLVEAERDGRLPTYAQCRAWHDARRTRRADVS